MKVLIVYHMYPHYRTAIVEELQSCTSHSFDFMGSEISQEGIPPINSAVFKKFIDAPYTIVRGIYWQWGAIKRCVLGGYDAYIFLGNPNFLSTWIAAAIARTRGALVLYWTHGWLKPERHLKRLLRNVFFSLAHVTMVYGERAKVNAHRAGFDSRRVLPIYNSLDLSKMEPVYSQLVGVTKTSIYGHMFSDPELPVVVCVARLTSLCRFDLLIEALKLLRHSKREINLVLIGDGPERPRLEALARSAQVPTKFVGECYDESVLGPLIFGADLAASPGKVGLTAIHCLSYGTPVFSHSALDEQMPEVESVVDGQTGRLFQKDSAVSLAEVILDWINSAHDRDEVRQRCRQVVFDKWNARTQSMRIVQAINLARTVKDGNLDAD